MKKFLPLWIVLAFLFIGCSSDDEATTTEIPDGPGAVTLQSEVNEFIWRGLNHWYFWQSSQEDLADDRFANTDEFFEYLNGFSNSQELFNSLIYQPGVVDDFSWYISDVDEQLNSFRGINESFGINLPRPGLVQVNQASNALVSFIAYVEPGSPADDAGLERGDLIYRVDGQDLTVDDFSAINNIFRNTTITLELANIVNDEIIPIDGEITITAEVITSNPVHFFDVIEEGGRKIGYLVYNGFRSTFNGELNEAFALFKNENIDELVLDMRYNGGGSVLTSSYLASMINGGVPAESDTFARLQYNEKRDEERGIIFPFFDDLILFDKTTSERIGEEAINRLNGLSRLYVLGGQRTASASEMIINGLQPYMPVILVGETTVGKNEGSITVVDSGTPFTNLENRNPNHTVGMQPIVFQVFNSLNESDYTFGFTPDIEVREAEFTADIRPFGDPNEALLRAALDDINGGTSTAKARLQPNPSIKMMEDGIEFPRFTNEMYLMDGEMK